MSINFTEPLITGLEKEYIDDAIKQKKLSGDGKYAHKCRKWFEENLDFKFNLLTPSCTASLEMAAILIDPKPGDEIIMPSYTFVSTANAFAMQGCRIKYVDVDPKTMNIDESLILEAITEKTKAIVVVHYGGISCDMDIVMEIAREHRIYVIEDAAQAILCEYKTRNVGTLAHMATFSFHDTKNFNSGGEGGLLVINDSSLFERSEIIREKGTNRSNFLRGVVDKYTWVDKGSSFLMSEIQAAFLLGQLERSKIFLDRRLEIWEKYYDFFSSDEFDEKIEIQNVPSFAKHNAHLFYLKLKDEDSRNEFIDYLKANNIQAASHYVPLHSSPFGSKIGKFHGKDIFTTIDSARLVRLPMHNNLNDDHISKVCITANDFLKHK
tara:strand:+ start:44 stop:1183 length:1140 start_codon:yes stop_codon:yes gene_type:complete